ncbi:MAG TPA: CoA-binding protein [Vicinamibacteria bacterium]|nr:CoA-binding protein [Vicinamibacteria bacterium]
MASKQTIDSFLSCRRLAVLGVSRNPGDFSRAMLRAFIERGYDAVPVNPNGGEADGRPFARGIAEVAPPVEAALLMTPPAATDRAVRECAEAGVKRVWMHRGGGQGAVSPEAVSFCRERGMEVVDGECPFMFLPDSSWFHGVHRFFRRLGGSLPS